MAKWTMDLESTIFSIVKTKVTSRLKSKYPNITFTTEESAPTQPKFPNIYIHMLDSDEAGEDLEGNTINGILAAFQIDVTTNTSKSDAKVVIYAVLDVFKEMRFKIKPFPLFTKEGDIHRGIMRARRMIGSGDIL